LSPRHIPRRLAIPLGCAGVVLAILAAPAQASVFGPRPGHSPNADDIRTAYWVAVSVAAILIVAVHVGGVMAVVRFRARRGREPRRFVAAPGALVRPALAMVAVAVGLFVVAIVIASDARDVQPTGPAGLEAQSDLVAQVGGLNVPPDAKPLEINVVGQRWLWRFEYPSGSPQPPAEVFSYNQLVVPVDTAVLLHVQSTDVLHRWFIPALGGQVDAIPGQVSDTWFRADREGTYGGQSTSFSGTSYAAMRAWVRVVSPEQYLRFIHRKRREIAAAQQYVQRKVQKQAAAPAPTP
jgi:cytochrome c oxidase subunit II